MPHERLAAREQAFRAGLERAVRRGAEMLAGGASSLDTVEAVVRLLEDDPLFNAGKGAVFTHEGTIELDAAIMNGPTLACGAIAGVRTVKNPITLARRVMEATPHAFLAGEGAEHSRGRRASRSSIPRTSEPKSVRTSSSASWAARAPTLLRCRPPMGTVARWRSIGTGSRRRDLVRGRTNKRFGRVGDVPVIGAGPYADNRTCAVSATGKGEEMIRHFAAANVSAASSTAPHAAASGA